VTCHTSCHIHYIMLLFERKGGKKKLLEKKRNESSTGLGHMLPHLLQVTNEASLLADPNTKDKELT
jgi:hypothetical protein